MLAEFCVCSSRVWAAVFAIYICAMMYGIFSIVGDPSIEKKSVINEQSGGKSEDAGGMPVYEDDLYRISAFKQGFKSNISADALRNLPIDFPLANGLAKPLPALRAGSVRTNATVAIGIPSIKRQGQDYLISTIESLVRHLTDEQKKDTIFVIYIGETDIEYLDQRVQDLQARFPQEIHEGLIEVIAPPKSLYPDWSKSVRSSFGDTVERSIWRSKQNLDQVFLMMYIYHLRSQYYLMMEDDVVATRDYMTKLRSTVKSRSNRPWTYISFCGLGAIGKLFRRRTLPSYASFLHTFWNAKPLDWLQVDFARSRICSYDEPEKICFKRLKTVTPETQPSLFQHIGKFSSLPGKIQKLRDGKFKH